MFHSEDEMRTVLGTIMGRYNEIVACLDTDPDDFDPVFLEGPEERSLRRIGLAVSSTRLRYVLMRGSRWLKMKTQAILMAPLFVKQHAAITSFGRAD